MADSAASLQVQQLLELLAVVSSLPDEESAVQGAVERAAQALEAEVAAVVFNDRVAAAVGFPIGAVPSADLLAVARRERDWLEVPGLDKCQAVAAPWGGTHPGHLILARWGDEPFSVEERNLVRGMARLLELTLMMLRTLQAEHAMREHSERQAAENARLLESLRQRQRLLEHLFVIQRGISRREPLQQILETVTSAAQDLFGDDIVGLWLRDPEDSERAKLRSSVGLSAKRLPGVLLTDAGAAGEAMRTDSVVMLHGYVHASPVIRDLTDDRLCASMAVPVHESGTVSGSLLVASYHPERRYTAADAQTLRAFAENVSLALTDAHTVLKMNQASHDALTGLASRGLFLERMSQQLSGAQDNATRVALLFVDLDRFKVVNDTLGHAAGDQLLLVTAERIRSQLRSSDFAGRFGGDEFAVMLDGVNSVREAVNIAERVVRVLNDPVVIAGRKLSVNASIGIALSSPDSPDPADLMRRADIAMYQAKRNGRGRYEVFAEEMLLAFAEGHLPR
ncbi:MAG TPA: sensor domain-containing diguanylate cyclase [Planosporangium sp.]|jgi:diguanylate cyclase (GGDEF)-like protein|nr:sensor domain-containing diguanylate cyclase [Planosporangium sp.]